MSRSYSKSYGRKVNANVPQAASIQFDKLFCENSNRPSAAKSTGTVGKWGITSFTSIRSTNFCIPGRREDSVLSSNKRKLNDVKISRSNKDLFKLEPSSPSPPAAAAPPPRPKKFFKSRNALEPPPPYPAQPTETARKYTGKASKSASAAQPRTPVTAASKKAFPVMKDDTDEEQTEAMNLSTSPTIETGSSPSSTPHHPPIVLRIFKGTSQIISNESAPAQNATSPVSTAPVTRSSRRRQNNNSDNSAAGHISPKRLRERNRDSTHDNNKTVHYQVEFKSELKSELVTESPTEELKPDDLPNKIDDEVLVPVEKEVEEGQEESAATVDETVPEAADVEMAEIKLEQVKSEEIVDIAKEKEEENAKHLEEAEAFLNSTKVDFNDVTSKILDTGSKKTSSIEEDREKLLRVLSGEDGDDDEEGEGEGEVKVKEEPPPPAVESKPAECLSEEEDSDSIADQITTLSEGTGVSSVKAEEEEQLQQAVAKSPVKVAPKKGSIFKSRGVMGGNKKRLALYKHKWCDDKEPGSGQGGQTPDKADDQLMVQGGANSGSSEDVLTRVTMYPDDDPDLLDNVEAVTSVKCSKNTKKFYTVVRNVKKAHQIQESGEFQEFNDDVEYILDALQDNNPIGTRCLSAITLASKCMAPAFRMHVRAHGTVARFFRALHDAVKDQSLGMCTATVMFVLSQDRLNMDLDRHCLELMLNLLESDTSHTSALGDCGLSDAQLHKTRSRVRQLCAEIQEKGHAKHLNLDNITVGHLAMETLLSLTSKRAGEWFKEELRELGGLEHIVKTVVECSKLIDFDILVWTPPILDRLRKVDRCLRVLENVTVENEENTSYLLTYGDGVLVNTLVRVFRVCVTEVCRFPSYNVADKESTGFVIRECLFANLKVLINLTHDFHQRSVGSTLTGGQEGLLNANLHVLIYGPEYVPEEQKFDLTVLALTLLINLVEHSESNRKLMVEALGPSESTAVFDCKTSAIETLVALFYKHEELARTEERKTDAILDGEKPESKSAAPPKSHEEHIEETVEMLLQKAGKNMEHTFIAAYVVLLLGYLTIENKDHETVIRSHLPNGNFETMLSILEKFFKFMTLTAAAGSGINRGIKAAEMVIKQLTQIDKR
ncbi:protein wings apart-like [Nilaparvata lugens]|uniref:protein wings apart-like n=1 Tax=Nilaparvata lugens TaxID=108931 RepID=UPI00193E91BF|nr:protein wings apart-like [Nilaparvata lugens]